MRYNRARAEVVSKAAAQPAAEGDNNMVNISWRKLSAVFLFGIAVYFASGDTLMASKQSSSTGVELDRLIPREKWAGAGLDKLTGAEQQTLADDINTLLVSARSTGNALPWAKDRGQWRMIQRLMSKDDVKKLLGEPMRVSVSRYYESWFYLGGNVTFDGKGRLDSWSEN